MTAPRKKEFKSIVTIDPQAYLPPLEQFVVFDLKDHLYKGLVLQERPFRDALEQLDLVSFQDKFVSIICSADAIIPQWAYMLAAAKLSAVAKLVSDLSGPQFQAEAILFNLSTSDLNELQDKRVVVKGCGEPELGPGTYMRIMTTLQTVCRSVSFGEPCSTVPVFKR